MHGRPPDERCRGAPGCASTSSPTWSARPASRIVYRAWDTTLQRRVAVKEYLPVSMATADRRLGRGDRGLGTPLGHLQGRPEELRRRGPAARPLRPPVAGQGLPLLGRERHRLHGDAVLRRPDPRGRARRARPRAGRGRAAGLAEAGAQRRVPAARRRRLAPEHRPRQHRPHAGRPGAVRPRLARSRRSPPSSTRRPRRSSPASPRSSSTATPPRPSAAPGPTCMRWPR